MSETYDLAGIPVLIALSKIDKYDPSLGPSEDSGSTRAHDVFYSKRIKSLVEVLQTPTNIEVLLSTRYPCWHQTRQTLHMLFFAHLAIACHAHSIKLQFAASCTTAMKARHQLMYAATVMSDLTTGAMMMQAVGESTGVGGTKDIFPIKNLTQEESEEGLRAIKILAFRLLRNALYAASDYLQDYELAPTQAAPTKAIAPACDNGRVLLASEPTSSMGCSSQEVYILDPEQL